MRENESEAENRSENGSCENASENVSVMASVIGELTLLLAELGQWPRDLLMMLRSESVSVIGATALCPASADHLSAIHLACWALKLKMQMTSYVRQLAHPMGYVPLCAEQLQLSLAVAVVVAAAAEVVVVVAAVEEVAAVVAAVAVAVLWHPATPEGD